MHFSLATSLAASALLLADLPTKVSDDSTGAAPAHVGINEAPVVPAFTTQVKPCGGATTVFTLDASAAFDPDGDAITFEWLACPGSTLSSTSTPVVQLTLDTSSACTQICGIRLHVRDQHDAVSAVRMYVEVVEGGGTEGCTPGYWKNHPEAWGSTGFLPTDDFDTVFGVDAFSPDRTLMEALKSGGGGMNKLGRAAVAALLSSTHSGVAYPRSFFSVIEDVHDAIVSGQLEPLATQLDDDNNLGCPL